MRTKNQKEGGKGFVQCGEQDRTRRESAYKRLRVAGEILIFWYSMDCFKVLKGLMISAEKFVLGWRMV